MKNEIKLNYFPNAIPGKEANAPQQVCIDAIHIHGTCNVNRSAIGYYDEYTLASATYHDLCYLPL